MGEAIRMQADEFAETEKLYTSRLRSKRSKIAEGKG
jgi:hypothetical protein